MKTKVAKKSVSLTKREAEALMVAVDMAIHVYGAPECEKCAKAFWGAIKKLDSTYNLGALVDEMPTD